MNITAGKTIETPLLEDWAKKQITDRLGIDLVKYLEHNPGAYHIQVFEQETLQPDGTVLLEKGVILLPINSQQEE